jgi:hypothetical protein
LVESQFGQCMFPLIFEEMDACEFYDMEIEEAAKYIHAIIEKNG